MNSKLVKFSVYLGVLLVTLGLSYYLFGMLAPSGSNPITGNKSIASVSPTQTVKKTTGYIDLEGARDQVCPINNTLHTQAEKDIWSTRRPLLVMIENHSDSRPQSGLSNADIVYEAVAEGGITRFMGVFYCNAGRVSTNKYDVGPVRSARTYFLDIASEYADYPLYAHVGGANCSAPKDPTTGTSGACTTDPRALAIEKIGTYGWTNKGTWGDLDQFSLSYKVCRREPERTGTTKDTEHTMYCSTQELWNTGKDRGLTNLTLVSNKSWDKNFRPWVFKQKDTPNSAATVTGLSFEFWPGYKDYSVAWKYDAPSNTYLRSNAGKSHIDFNSGEQITTKNVVIQFAKETRSLDVHLHNLYEVIGSGKGVVLQNGVKQDITWSKASRTARTTYKDSSGKDFSFVPGNVWVEILPIGTNVSYEGQSQP
jgi:hypothetical protein